MGSTVHWPMSNEDLQIWFSRANIPIEELIEMWLHMDQGDMTRLEVKELCKTNNAKELENRLRHRIQFGTAGLFSCGGSYTIRSAGSDGGRLLANERFNSNTSFPSFLSKGPL